MRILLVENSIDLANLIAESLKEKKIYCATRSSALGALEALENEKFDILISDLHLDHINGEELAKRARKKYNIPTLLMSADYAVENSKHFDAFILKPFDISELLEMIEIVAQKSKTSRPQGMHL